MAKVLALQKYQLLFIFILNFYHSSTFWQRESGPKTFLSTICYYGLANWQIANLANYYGLAMDLNRAIVAPQNRVQSIIDMNALFSSKILLPWDSNLFIIYQLHRVVKDDIFFHLFSYPTLSYLYYNNYLALKYNKGYFLRPEILDVLRF